MIPLMLALTSCSTIGNMHNTPPSVQHKPQVIKSHHQISKPHHINRHVHHAQKPAQVILHKNKVSSANIVKMPVKAATVVKAASKSPIVTSGWLLNDVSINISPRSYTNAGRRHDILANLDYMDSLLGQYHYIQVVRWNGVSINESIINT